ETDGYVQKSIGPQQLLKIAGLTIRWADLYWPLPPTHNIVGFGHGPSPISCVTSSLRRLRVLLFLCIVEGSGWPILSATPRSSRVGCSWFSFAHFPGVGESQKA